jgi:hypothetical protein
MYYVSCLTGKSIAWRGPLYIHYSIYLWPIKRQDTMWGFTAQYVCKLYLDLFIQS